MFSDDQDNYYEFDDDEDTLDLYPCKDCGQSRKKCPTGGDCDCGGNCGDDCECERDKEPIDNNGRDVCFWCGKKTVLKPGFSFNYEYCEYCKK